MEPGPKDAETDLGRHAVSLRDTLKELLQYDRSDLDFGIYRILNACDFCQMCTAGEASLVAS